MRLGICQHRRRHGTQGTPPGPPQCPPVPAGGTVGGVTVRQATAADVEPMAAQLCRAFSDDPVMGYVFRNEGRRTKAMRSLLHHPDAGRLPAVRRLLHHRRPPGCGRLGPGRQAAADRAGRPRQPVSGSSPMSGRPPQVHAGDDQPDRIDASARAPLVSRHLGDRSRGPGQGIGSALMRPVLDHCDAEGWPAYLESSKERNVPFYARHGFEVVKELPLPRGGPSIWTMWREPRGAPGAAGRRRDRQPGRQVGWMPSGMASGSLTTSPRCR